MQKSFYYFTSKKKKYINGMPDSHNLNGNSQKLKKTPVSPNLPLPLTKKYPWLTEILSLFTNKTLILSKFVQLGKMYTIWKRTIALNFQVQTFHFTQKNDGNSKFSPIHHLPIFLSRVFLLLGRLKKLDDKFAE